MGLIWRRRKRIGGTDVNMSTGGATVSRRVGRQLRVNSRGGGSFRLLRGLSWRFGPRR